MAVSLTGSRGLSMAKVKTVSIVFGVAGALSFYLYGPAVTPMLYAAAATTCNEMTGGNFRSYQLDWVVAARPHWSCRDRSDPAKAPMNMGWWVGR